MLLHLIRHGETTFNAEGRIQGQHDTPLSPLGLRQAQAVAAAFDRRPIQRVFSSPLSRALETARPLAERLGVDVRTDERLMELNAGVFQMLLPSEMAERFPEATACWRSHDPDFRIPGGESRRQLMQRGEAVLRDVAATGLEAAAIVAHGGLLTAALKALLGVPAERNPFMLYNGSISTVEWGPPLRLLTLNEIDHLRTPDGSPATRLGDL